MVPGGAGEHPLRYMEHDPQRPSLPAIPAPPTFSERRHAFRRGEDLAVHEDRALLARALDILAGPGDAATQVADILALLARVVGARRAALVTDRPLRRVIVVAAPGEDPADAHRLAAWLDVSALRSAAVRAAAPPAEVIIVRTRHDHLPRAAAPASAPANGELLADRMVRLGARGAEVQVGLELASMRDAARVAVRLPAPTLRHLLAALAAASRRAADEAERRDLQARERERERFVSTVAHELRTPLTGLGGYLDLLADGAIDDPDVGREFIGRGRGIVERMALLVGDLLELSRIESGSLRLDIEPVSLAEACDRAMAPLGPIAAGRDIRLVVGLPPRIRTVRADRRRVEQIVTNLAGNACKFAPAGGLVEVNGRVDGPAAIVIVRDDGPGIQRDDHERVFRPFARLDGHERVPGTGLGLSISRDLARAMGGDIAVASVAGSGSSFVLGLPTGPDVPPSLMSAAIEEAAEREEIALEERAVLRALRAGAPAARATAAGERPTGDARSARESVVDAA
jgi:signal transduction histidine kinase